MLVNTAEKLLNRSTVKLLETYYKGNVKVYKILLAINRYEEGAYSPLVVDNIIMTICRNNLFNKIYFDVLGSTSRRCFSMFATYKECLGEYEFAEYIRALENQCKTIAGATGLAGHRAHIVRREAWHNETLARS